MALGVLLLSAATTAIVAGAYLYLAARLARRSPGEDPEATRALRLFAMWWGLTALNQFAGAALYAAAALGWVDLTAQVTYAVVQRLLLSASMVGLMAYLLYLFRGRTRLVPLTLVYGAFYAFQLWTIFARDPTDVLVSRWRTDLAYAGALPGWTDLVTFLVLVLPPVVGSVAYLRLARRVPSRSARVRVVAVAGGLLAWWVFAVAVGRPALYDADGLQLANRLLGLVVALGILFAFEPTRWMQRRFALEPYAAAA